MTLMTNSQRADDRCLGPHLHGIGRALLHRLDARPDGGVEPAIQPRHLHLVAQRAIEAGFDVEFACHDSVSDLAGERGESLAAPVQQRLDCTRGHRQKLADFFTTAIFQIKKDDDAAIGFRQLLQQLRHVVFGGRLAGGFGAGLAACRRPSDRRRRRPLRRNPRAAPGAARARSPSGRYCARWCTARSTATPDRRTWAVPARPSRMWSGTGPPPGPGLRTMETARCMTFWR